ncbi:MAG TPA: hypothetical protein V6C46_05860 [Coleofasciculaceae cyanobacterium]
MTFTPPNPIANTQMGNLAIAAIQNIIGGQFGTDVYHFQAQLAPTATFDDRDRPDYLAAEPGFNSTGIIFVANPKNPIKGIFCQAPQRPIQENAGIYFQADMELYLPEDIGPTFVVDTNGPKRQDKFVIFGTDYYSANPATPCILGMTTACWKISLTLQRYPVQN